MVEALARVPVPIVYPASADKIGLLGRDAMDVVIVYSLIEAGRSGTAWLINSRTPDDIPPSSIEVTAEAFLRACAYAQSVLPKLRTGVAEHDQKDAELIEKIRAAVAFARSHATNGSSPGSRSSGLPSVLFAATKRALWRLIAVRSFYNLAAGGLRYGLRTLHALALARFDTVSCQRVK